VGCCSPAARRFARCAAIVGRLVLSQFITLFILRVIFLRFETFRHTYSDRRFFSLDG
jgi:hypothetical protein